MFKNKEVYQKKQSRQKHVMNYDTDHVTKMHLY